MTDITYLKSVFRILIDKVKLKKQINKEIEDLCFAFFLSGFKYGSQQPLNN